MGLTENAVLQQLKKGQGETNARLDRISELIAELVKVADGALKTRT